MEGAPNNPEKESNEFDSPQAVPEVLTHLHTIHGHRHDRKIEPPELLHQEILKTKHGEHYQHVPTFNHLNTSIARVLTLLDLDIDSHTPDTELFKQKNLIKDRVKHIRTAVNQYVGCLMQFYRITKNPAWREDPGQIERLQEIDVRRRRAHNTVIESLTVYTRLIVSLYKEGYLDGLSLKEWSTGDPVPQIENNHRNIVVFSGQFLRNREQVKDWAVQADIAFTMEEVIATYEQQKTGTPNFGGAR